MTVLASGQRVSEYILEEKVGEGGFGEVWLARHHLWKDTVVAMKFARDGAFLHQLRNEGVLQHRLEHPNIVKTLGADLAAAVPYVVTEFVEGESLRDLLRREGELPVVRAVAILREVLEALEYAHNTGILHLDIKPENILLSRDGQVRLTDFGLARVQNQEESLALSGALASGGVLSGTLAYISPEQCRLAAAEGLENGDREGAPFSLDGRSDLYSIGIVFFEMLTGELPQGAELPRQLRPQLPRWVDRVFGRLYARRERRYASAAAVLTELPTVRRDANGRDQAVQESPRSDTEHSSPVAVGAEPAGFLLRLYALAIDLVVFVVAVGTGGLVFPQLRALERGSIGSVLLAFLLYGVLVSLFHAVLGKTPGKLCVRIRVVRDEDPARPPGLLRSIARTLGYVISLLPLPILPIGFLWVALSPDGRGFHDYFAGTRVVRTA